MIRQIYHLYILWICINRGSRGKYDSVSIATEKNKFFNERTANHCYMEIEVKIVTKKQPIRNKENLQFEATTSIASCIIYLRTITYEHFLVHFLFTTFCFTAKENMGLKGKLIASIEVWSVEDGNITTVTHILPLSLYDLLASIFIECFAIFIQSYFMMFVNYHKIYPKQTILYRKKKLTRSLVGKSFPYRYLNF